MVEVFFDKTKLLDNDFLSLYYTKGSNEYVIYIVDGEKIDIKKTLDELKERIVNKTQRFNNIELKIARKYLFFKDNVHHEMEMDGQTIVFENGSIRTAVKKYDRLVYDMFWEHCGFSKDFSKEIETSPLNRLSFCKVNCQKITITMTMNNKWNHWFLNLFRDIF